MSELFESLQFPIQPNSSPLLSSCPLQEAGGSSRRNQAKTGGLTAAATAATRSDYNSINVKKATQNNLHQPKTPHTKSHSASSVSASTLYDCDEQQYLSSTTTPTFASSTSSSRLIRPGHVFWHATPSPSQQIRQNEWQHHISSSTSPTLPLGTQAFRDELLHQGVSSAALKCRQSLIAGSRVGDDSFSTSDRSVCTIATSLTSGSSISRKFSRKVSRKSTGTVGNSSVLNKSQGGEEMLQLLADLNQHLQSHKNEVDDAEEESLVEELDRVFSSQKDISDSQSQIDRQEDQEMQDEKHRKDRRKTTNHSHSPAEIKIQPSPSGSREWTRTKSLPTWATSPRQEGRTSLTKVHSGNIIRKETLKTRQNSIKRTHSPSPRPRSSPSDCSGEEARGLTASPTKRSCEHIKQTTKGKTRSSVSPPKKWETRRTPRIGLSRHSLNASQVSSSSLQSGPAAPFKRPTKAVNIIAQRGATKSKHVIVIDDSDEEVWNEESKQSVQPIRRTSPRKKITTTTSAAAKQQLQPLMNIKQAKAPLKMEEKKKEMDEDTSFDTSMDDTMLCEALDQAEARASQEAFQASQQSATMIEKKTTTRLPSIGDDSFEMASSDNEAILSAMEAKGW